MPVLMVLLTAEQIADSKFSKQDDLPHRLIGHTLQEVERELILDMLAHCEGNRVRTAENLGIAIRTLRNKIKMYRAQGIAVPSPSALARARS